MNSNVIAKRSNITFLIAAMFMSIVMLVLGGFFLNSLISGGSDKFVQVAKKSCLSTIRESGFLALPGTSEIKVSKVNSDIEQLVFQSGVLIASCPAYTLNDYCAGAGCQTPGVQFTLKLKE